MIINNIEIVNTVKSIELEYNKSTTSTHYAILYSKLAIIEFCGWIEQTFDEILTEYTSTKILPESAKYIKETVIDPNYGFHYDKNFRKMIMAVIGISNLEDLEDYLENTNAELSTFKSILGTFTKMRNTAAHTYTPKGCTITYQSPSVVLSNISKITPILQKIALFIMKCR